VSLVSSTFSQLVMLGSSGMLLTALIVLWRKGVPAYITAYRWQAWLLAALTAIVGYYGGDPSLYWVAALLLLLKGIAIPALLRTMQRRFGAQREETPYVNTETSLLIASVLVVFAYLLARPWMTVTHLPTRQGLPVAMSLLFVSLFIVVSRKKAITQVIGFLMLENAIALLAVVGTYGVPFLVEFGVFLDALMGFLVMQIFVYQIHETFETLDVEQLTRLRH
jgi:hydrogenase-4 component E